MSYSPNSPCASTYIFDILAQLDSREYPFLTYLPNSTRASHNINTKHAADGSVSTRASTHNIRKIRTRKFTRELSFLNSNSLRFFVFSCFLWLDISFYCYWLRHHDLSVVSGRNLKKDSGNNFYIWAFIVIFHRVIDSKRECFLFYQMNIFLQSNYYFLTQKEMLM